MAACRITAQSGKPTGWLGRFNLWRMNWTHSKLTDWGLQHIFYGRQRLFRATTMRKIPTHDLPRAAVDHADQIGPTYGRPRPDLGHIRLPDLIRLCCFHTSPLFLPSGSQAS